MKKFNFILLVCLLGFLTSCNKNDTNPISPDYSETKDLSCESLLYELNYARTKPAEYAKLIEAMLPYYSDYNGESGVLLTYPGETPILTNEGKQAAIEAINFLKKQAAVSSLKINNALNQACKYHCDKQGPTGKIGHDSPDGKTLYERMKMYGTFGNAYGYGENIAYGTSIPRRIIIQLIIDDGVPSRGHRDNIYETKWTDVGFAWGHHKTYNIMCTMDFAYGYSAFTF